MGKVTDAAAKAARRKAALRKLEPRLPDGLTYWLSIVVALMAAAAVSVSVYGRLTRDAPAETSDRQTAAGAQSLPAPVSRIEFPLEPESPCPIDGTLLSDHPEGLRSIAAELAADAESMWDRLETADRVPTDGTAYLCVLRRTNADGKHYAAVSVLLSEGPADPAPVLSVLVSETPDGAWETVPDTPRGPMADADRETSEEAG